MEENTWKGLTAAAFAAVGAYFRQLTFPLVLLVAVMSLDYASGMTRAWAKGELSAKVGLLGIVKKVSYMLIVAVAVTVDWVVRIAAGEAGVPLEGSYFCALLVAVWLILNECISILENVNELGAPVPSFLVKLAGKLKQSAERKGETLDGGERDDQQP